MASANKKSSLDGLSDKRLALLRSKHRADINKINANIDKIQSKIDAYMKSKAKQDDYFDSKNDGYKDLANQSNTIDEKIKKLLDSKSKSSSVKKSNAKKIADFNEQKSKLTAKMRDIRNSSNYQNAKNDYARLENNIKNANKAISQNKSNRKTTRSKLDAVNAVIKKRQEVKQKKTARKNSAKIANQMKKDNYQHTYLYPTDFSKDKAIVLSEYDPSESGDVNLPTQPIDTKMPTANYATANSRTMSGNYRLVIGDHYDSLEDLQDAYVDIIHYANNGTEMHLDGFSKWNHAFISSYGKQSDTTANKNQLILNLTFQYARLSKIMTSKSKKGKKRGKKSKTSGSATKANPNRNKKVSVNDNAINIAQRANISVSDLKVLNPKLDVTSNVKGKVVIG